MAKYLVQYSTPQFNKQAICVWAKDKSEAKKMLKRHLGNTLFTINKITVDDVSEYPPYSDREGI